MYAIYKDNEVIQYSDSISYVRKTRSGSPEVVREKRFASGIVSGSNIYNLVGHSDFSEAVQVSVAEVDNSTALNNAVTSATSGDSWNPVEIYYAGTYVMYHNSLWICNIQNKGVMPEENSVYWTKLNIASELNRLATLINNKEDKQQ